MDKQKLLKLRKLYPTRRMMEMAGQDVPGKRTGYRNEIIDVYRYGIYMRCQVLEGVLKTAFFLTDRMRLGIREPVYEVFINKDSGEFLTWDAGKGKWRTAKVDMLDWPEYTWNSGRYINPEGYRNIKKYLGTQNGGYKGILEYQQEIRKEELKEKHRRETEPWDLEMDQIPPLPKDWMQWADKKGMLQHYIFYDYSRKVNAGYCTGCEKLVDIRNPRHNHYGTCPGCGRRIQYKARGRAGSFTTGNEIAYLLQRCEDGIVIREFALERRYTKGEYETPERNFREIRRTIHGVYEDSLDLYGQVYYYGFYRNSYMRWIKDRWGRNLYYSRNGTTYRRTLPSLERNELKRTGLAEYIRGNTKTDPGMYLAYLRRRPELEQLSKAGLTRLAWEIVQGLETGAKPEPGKELARALGIDRARMKRLREHNGGLLYLRWLVQEKQQDTIYDDSDLEYLEGQKVAPDGLKQMREHMGMKECCNYLRRQQKITAERAAQLIATYEDYIMMARRLKMDTGKELVYKPKNLKEAHDKVVALCGGQQIARRAAEVAEKFPDIDGICEGIKEKYAYAGKKYQIVVPERIEDIIREGEVLGHCLHSSDRYFERIHRRESYIVFLRKTGEPDRPWYTLEIEPDGTARQKRTAGDRQDADLEDAMKFIRRWQQEVQKRLTGEDRELAEKSGALRLREFEELRKEQKKVWHGALKGKLLVDVLEADLMEAALAATS